VTKIGIYKPRKPQGLTLARDKVNLMERVKQLETYQLRVGQTPWFYYEK
jgi:hypothetical protein